VTIRFSSSDAGWGFSHRREGRQVIELLNRSTPQYAAGLLLVERFLKGLNFAIATL
jgi:hypothetical protein